MATNIKGLTAVKAMNPKELNAQSVSLLNARLVDEYTAHFFYRIASNWCKGVGYNNAAAFFADEAEQELQHAEGLQQYLVDWNINPTMPAVKPAINFIGLIDIVNKAYALEYDLFTKYNADSAKVFATDLPTFDFLQKYRDIQTKSVAEYSDLLNAAQLIDPTILLDIIHYEEIYFKVN
jgi:ferritin